MKVIYTEIPGKEVDTCYRLPDPFYGAISAATEVVVEGDFPHVVEAYKAIGIEVKKPIQKRQRQEKDEG